MQFVDVFALIACAAGSPIVATPYGLAAPVASPAVIKSVEYDANPHYSYTYSVNDASTGDSKSQSESRDGDVVTGDYSFVEADGSIRRVTYNADPVNGFNAVVSKSAAVAPVAKVIAPVAAAYHAPLGKSILLGKSWRHSLILAPLTAAYAHAPVAAYAHGPIAAYAHGPAVAKAIAPAYPYYG